MNYNINKNLQKLAIAGLLCAVGILIPLVSPIKVMIEPASFTLASHVAIFIAMFISPAVAVFVAIGTAIGFFLSFPLVVAIRAFSHIVFAVIGAFILKRSPQILDSPKKLILFALGISLIHVLCEVGVVIPFFFGGSLSAANYAKGFVYSIVLLVGGGGFIHSLVDFAIALAIWRPLKKAAKL